MKYSDLEAGQEFVIIGRKTPHGFIALETGEAFYKIDGDVPVSAQQSVHRTASPVRVLNAICYGTTLATFLWLLFGSR